MATKINEMMSFKDGQVAITLPPASWLKIAAGVMSALDSDTPHADELEALAGMFYAASRAAFEQMTPAGIGPEAIEADWARLVAEGMGEGESERGGPYAQAVLNAWQSPPEQVAESE